jgi:squalene-hopene/tetraprenyl-beta-curcumene cyclase
MLEAQNPDGGWGGSGGVTSSIEETGVVLTALGRSVADGDERQVSKAVARGAHWLIEATGRGEESAAAPLGLYFARLWYYEELYPLVFAIGGLAAARTVPASRHDSGSATRIAPL